MKEMKKMNKERLNHLLNYLKNNNCCCNLGDCEVCETINLIKNEVLEND
jgi:hypothetical protein